MASAQYSSLDLDQEAVLRLYKEKGYRFDIAEGLKCLICKSILLDPIQTDCGCRYCRSCIEKYLSDGKKRCIGGSEDCETFIDNILSDRAIKKEIANVKVKCLYDKCTFEDTLKNMTSHLTSCQYRMETCTLCGQFYFLKQKDTHLVNDCPMREEKCIYCHGNFTHTQYKTVHLNTDHAELCSKYTCPCPYNCGIKKDVVLFEHRKICTSKPAMCPFKDFDCHTVLATEKMQKHLISECYQHSQKLVESIDNLKNEIKELRNSYDLLKIENTQLTKKYEILQLESEKKFAQLEKSKTQYQSNMSSKNETVFRNGKYIWKICNFSKLKDNAMKGITLTVTSDSFYTSEFGYRMCLKIYPYGDGVGKGTHLSVFFVIMRGEYDDLQAWPFRNKVTLTILEDMVKATNHSDTFKPDARSVCYQKPDDEFNIASGSPKFISFIELSRFLKNDTLYLQIVVLS